MRTSETIFETQVVAQFTVEYCDALLSVLDVPDAVPRYRPVAVDESGHPVDPATATVRAVGSY